MVAITTNVKLLGLFGRSSRFLDLWLRRCNSGQCETLHFFRLLVIKTLALIILKSAQRHFRSWVRLSMAFCFERPTDGPMDIAKATRRVP
jgi:hypothetical protein